jgi:hypothetical protein
MPFAYAGARAQGDFLIGSNPTTELGDDFRDHSFFNTTFRFGFNYQVPAGRRAFIHRIDIIVRVDGIIVPGGTIRVDQNFFVDGGIQNSMRLMSFVAGEGGGVSNILGKPFGLLNPLDTLQTFLASTNCGTSGNYLSMIRGVEYDA